MSWRPPAADAPAPAAISDTQPSGTRLTPQRRRLIGINAAIFLFTFLVYWLTGPLGTPYDFQLSQANNILHGHLDMTEEYTHNLGILERVLYDGVGFCLPTDDPRGDVALADIENPRVTDNCKHFMQHSLGPAFILLPLVAVFGLDVSQTLVSAIIGAFTAVLVYAITRCFSSDLRTQLVLTALAAFGTTFWYSAADGSVWHFAHTTAVFFLFASIYATVGLRNPLLAGAFVGAAFLCRPTTGLAGLFPLVAFSDRWLVADAARSLASRLRLRPLVELALGVAPFFMLFAAVNYLRFGSPLETGYSYSEEFHQISLKGFWTWGIFSPNYIDRHVQVFFEQMPLLGTRGSFVWPSWAGLAFWITSPALLLSLFVHLRRRTSMAQLGGVALALGGALMLIGTFGQQLGTSTWTTAQLPLGLHLLPFWLMIGIAVTMAVGLRDRLAIACWAAIIPIALFNWMFAATGWAQFGYRYALDFMPFVWLLAVLAVPKAGRFHLLLIAISVLVNLWGVLWIFKFNPAHLFGWTWVGW